MPRPLVFADENGNYSQNLSRKANGGLWTKRYERTLKGKLVRTYRNMYSRVKGLHRLKAHLYEGKDIIGKEDFYEWSLNDPDYLRLHDEWIKSGFSRSLSPSIDRIDPEVGYVIGNMRWITHGENSLRGTIARNSKHGIPNRWGH